VFLDGPFKGQQITVMAVKEFIESDARGQEKYGDGGFDFAAYVIAGHARSSPVFENCSHVTQATGWWRISGEVQKYP
jgi:hypothetical protein